MSLLKLPVIIVPDEELRNTFSYSHFLTKLEESDYPDAGGIKVSLKIYLEN